MDKKLAFNCRTLEDAQDFIYQCVERDIQVWRSACWEVYREDTCFAIKDNGLMYCNKDYYLINDYEIITYEKGDDIYGGKFERLKGEGLCTCRICNSFELRNWCYRVFDKNSEHNHKVICSQCKIKMESEK